MRILAIDQGTTSTRGFLLGPEGVLQPVFAAAHGQFHPQPGHVEHDGLELLRHVRGALDAVEGHQISAIGIDNQGESCLGWDADTGEPVGPVIVWQDGRTADMTARLRAQGAEAQVLQLAGLPLDPYFSASKLGWICRNLPRAAELMQRGKLRLGTTDAFFRDRLTGRFETDITTASRTSLLNLETGQWDGELCRLFGVPLECLPAITASHGGLGEMRVGARGLPLCASVVDQQASLYGHGCRAPGDRKITFGTGAFALQVTRNLARCGAGAVLPTIAWQQQGQGRVHALDGGVYCASSAVDWARGLGLFSDYDSISAFDGPSAASRGLIFVPALAGLACPHWDRGARGTWMGLGLDTTSRDMVRAVLEGVALRMAEVLEAMERVSPASGFLSVDGGMTANGYFCQFLADTLGMEIRVSQERELTALGTGLLAAEAAGLAITPAHQHRRMHPRAGGDDRRDAFARAVAAVKAFGGGVVEG